MHVTHAGRSAWCVTLGGAPFLVVPPQMPEDIAEILARRVALLMNRLRHITNDDLDEMVSEKVVTGPDGEEL